MVYIFCISGIGYERPLCKYGLEDPADGSDKCSAHREAGGLHIAGSTSLLNVFCKRKQK